MGKSFLLESHVRVQVDLGRFNRFMAEPESDYAQVHPASEQIHGGIMPKSVRRHRFTAERGAGHTCGGGMSDDKSLKSVEAHSRTARTGENGVNWIAASLC